MEFPVIYNMKIDNITVIAVKNRDVYCVRAENSL